MFDVRFPCIGNSFVGAMFLLWGGNSETIKSSNLPVVASPASIRPVIQTQARDPGGLALNELDSKHSLRSKLVCELFVTGLLGDVQNFKASI